MTTDVQMDSSSKSKYSTRSFLTLRNFSFVLIIVGLLISGYLSYTELFQTEVQCVEGAGFDCDAVQGSNYSKLAGIPVAYLGFGTYLLLGGLLLFQNRLEILRSYGLVLFFGITLFAFLFSMWLVYVQAVLIANFCIWCLGHEVIITILFMITGIRLWRALQED